MEILSSVFAEIRIYFEVVSLCWFSWYFLCIEGIFNREGDPGRRNAVSPIQSKKRSGVLISEVTAVHVLVKVMLRVSHELKATAGLTLGSLTLYKCIALCISSGLITSSESELDKLLIRFCKVTGPVMKKSVRHALTAVREAIFQLRERGVALSIKDNKEYLCTKLRTTLRAMSDIDMISIGKALFRAIKKLITIINRPKCIDPRPCKQTKSSSRTSRIRRRSHFRCTHRASQTDHSFKEKVTQTDHSVQDIDTQTDNFVQDIDTQTGNSVKDKDTQTGNSVKYKETQTDNSTKNIDTQTDDNADGDDDGDNAVGRDETDLCSVCLEEERDCVITPCCHLCTCYQCGLRLFMLTIPECPVCRRGITQIIRVYR